MESKNFVADECSKPSHIKYLKSRGGVYLKKTEAELVEQEKRAPWQGCPALYFDFPKREITGTKMLRSNGSR